MEAANNSTDIYRIVPQPTLASGKLPSGRPDYHYKVQVRYRLDTFTCFSKLSIELRLKIWHYAPPIPRIIQVLIELEDPPQGGTPTDHFRCRLTPNNAFGRGHLLACHESAIVFKATYDQFTVDGAHYEGAGFFNRDVKSGRHSLGYIDYRCDTLAIDLMDTDELSQMGVTFDLRRIEKLALVETVWPGGLDCLASILLSWIRYTPPTPH